MKSSRNSDQETIPEDFSTADPISKTIRANTVATKSGNSRGTVHNVDTGWNINVSGKVFPESQHRANKNTSAIPHLQNINDIVEKAVLLDSYSVGQLKSPNSLLMHSMYAVSDIGYGPELLKLYVEEMNDPNSVSTGKRAYQLQNIEKASAVAGGVQGTTPSSLATTTNVIRIVADLYASVKDKVNVMNIRKGRLLKDITKIRNITQDIVSSYGLNPKSNFLRDILMNSLSPKTSDVNPDSMKSSRNRISEEVKAHDADRELWEQEFSRLSREYERLKGTSADKVRMLEEKVKHQREAAHAKVESARKTEMRHKIQNTVNVVCFCALVYVIYCINMCMMKRIKQAGSSKINNKIGQLLASCPVCSYGASDDIGLTKSTPVPTLLGIGHIQIPSTSVPDASGI